MKILYFTSTGNNLYIAKNLGGELLSIPQLIKGNAYDFEDDAIGIIFPVFYANAPKIVREFIDKASFKTDYLFLRSPFIPKEVLCHCFPRDLILRFTDTGLVWFHISKSPPIFLSEVSEICLTHLFLRSG